MTDGRFHTVIDCERIPEVSCFGGLVRCRCGHALGRHSLAGCDRRASCRCMWTLSGIVDVEIAAVIRDAAEAARRCKS